MAAKVKLTQVDEQAWEVPVGFVDDMNVPGRIYANPALMDEIENDASVEQVANVATLRGIVRHSFAMPDIHWGYGFPIGGVAATRTEDGVISPGGVGFDINCGVRLLRTDLQESEVRPRLDDLVNRLYRDVPSGVGSEGAIRLSSNDSDRVMTQGAGWAVANGYGEVDDLDVTEERGAMDGADPAHVGDRPRKRGAGQIGTLGSGNHFLEVQSIDEVYDKDAAAALGIDGPRQVVVMFHCGSRGFGHQVCQDYVSVVSGKMREYDLSVPDRQLACAPVSSTEGQAYLSAMKCAANFAWANRQVIAHWTRETFERVFRQSWSSFGMRQVYDVSHNMAKIETHVVDGDELSLCVHRKGATRAFPPGHEDVPARYRDIGQPVLIPGDMGRSTYLCAGGRESLEKSFGSACHGAGRRKSRHAAKRSLKGRDIRGELREQGVVAMSRGWASLAEEASEVYKDVEEVVDVCHRAGLATKVARMKPLGVIKG